jgi:2-aminobenzoate-CoA ligase
MIGPMAASAYVDRFVLDRLPVREALPEFLFDRPEFQFPERVNCAAELIDGAVAGGHGARAALIAGDRIVAYSELLADANRIANVLVGEMGVVPGNRVLLFGPNSPYLAACWLAVVKAGGVAVMAMPMLRAKELAVIAERAAVDHALCDARLLGELAAAAAATGRLQTMAAWGEGYLEARMARASAEFATCDTARDDPCLIAFTSGTTGAPKACVHFHRDVLAMNAAVGTNLLQLGQDDICVGSPPFGFTFGLGALLTFPLAARGASALVEKSSPEALLSAVERHRATALFTAPTMYRALLKTAEQYDLSSLRLCISAGEPLPKGTSDAFAAATGLRIVDGIGATEMIHIFISAAGSDIRPGATGKPLPGYRACVLGADGRPSQRGTGRLAVKGPTGCRYLDDPRQRDYVVDGWNVTGDVYRIDEDGYFWFEARADDMIVSAGYNIAAPEVEAALLEHPAVKECAVVGAPDEERGRIVKAFVVAAGEGSAPLARELQDFVKARIAPYKYPRAVEFVDALPKTATGKIERRALRASESQ